MKPIYADHADIAWRWRAACAGVDPRVFFPEKKEDIDAAAWKQYCDRCPVRAECAAAGVHELGVWGGVFHGRALMRQTKGTT